MSEIELSVIVHFLSTSEGGRRGWAGSGYRPQFSGLGPPLTDEQTSDGQLTFEAGQLEPGESGAATLVPLISPQYWTNVQAGWVLKIWEGRKQVGTAVVLEVRRQHISD